MDEHGWILLPLSLLVFITVVALQEAEANFTDTTYFTWGAQHSSILRNGEDLQLVMVKTSGSAVESRSTYLFGSIEMMMKLVPGNSAGTNTAFYLSSIGEKHDEIDFEFLGGLEGKYYIVHTNIFVQGKGEREQEFFLWFDPTLAYHNYTIHWNPNQVVWLVDSVPIRIYRNYESQGIPFPNKQGMKMRASLWNAEWATDGGRIKIDWKYAPFRAQFRNFRTRACSWVGPASINNCAVSTPTNWFASASHNQLNPANKYQMKRVRDKYMIYDYCKDGKRFNLTIPHECSKPQY